jgi:putative DNA primase/helicase
MDNKEETIEELEQRIAVLKAQSVLIFPELDDRTKPKATVANLRELLLFHNISVRYNEMSRDVEIYIPGFKSTGDLYRNVVLEKIADICAQCNFKITIDRLNGLIDMIAFENEYHPVRDWIDQQVWDGRSRLQDLYDSVILTKPNSMKDTILRKWALSAVAALYQLKSGYKFNSEGVLTFSGRQGIGKTTWIEQLLPKQGRGIWNKGGVVLNMNDKDTQLKALSVWICELGELDATFKKSDIEQLKGFITNDKDSIRPPYAKKANDYARGTVFYATVNEQQFLQDSENRRFWVLEVDRFINGNLDAAQLWAEVKQIYLSIRDKCNTVTDSQQSGVYGWFMSPSERAQMRPLQDLHKVINPIEEILTRVVEPNNIVEAARWEWRTVTEVLQRGRIPVPSKAQANDAAKWFRKNGYQEDSRHRFKAEFTDENSQGYVDTTLLRQKVVNLNKGRD